MTKSMFDVVAELDNFPYCEDDPNGYKQCLSNYYAFKVHGIDAILGYVPSTIVTSFSWPSDSWVIDSTSQTIMLNSHPRASPALRTEILTKTLRKMAESGNFKILKGWRNEMFPIYGPNGDLILEIERAASSLFGVTAYGVQMICYTEDSKELRLWIARRSRLKQTYPGMLDCTAAGGLGSGDLPWDAVAREAEEEASIKIDVIRARANPFDRISYFHVKSARSEETSLLLPEVEYLYELKLNTATIPRPSDSEVEEFHLWTIEKVLEALRNGEFKPNSAVVLINFFIRRGIPLPEMEPDYSNIMARLHRELPFPTVDHFKL